ncbi:DgyrCDS9939 [Dimorphilus gyrociliatus]|uniref:DgyrCDS9939 n=1 Tax=Dimorphilus gyrociliatus TaxID=2664684 RepID=A0A7I8W0Q4_9ANNE|nr:DgyrCDS9939 [Dimorphilus gyrociliatus]
MIAQQFRANCGKCNIEQRRILPDLTSSNHSISTCLANGAKLDKCIETRCDNLYTKVLAKSLQDSCLTVAGCFRINVICITLAQKIQTPPIRCRTLNELKTRCYCNEYQEQRETVMKLLEDTENCVRDNTLKDLMGSGEDKSGDYSGDYNDVGSGSGSGAEIKDLKVGITACRINKLFKREKRE